MKMWERSSSPLGNGTGPLWKIFGQYLRKMKIPHGPGIPAPGTHPPEARAELHQIPGWIVHTDAAFTAAPNWTLRMSTTSRADHEALAPSCHGARYCSRRASTAPNSTETPTPRTQSTRSIHSGLHMASSQLQVTPEQPEQRGG